MSAAGGEKPAGAHALVACDLDGTLVDEAGEPYPGIVAALAALSAASLRIVLCTGRTVGATRAGARRLGLAGGYAIAYHGAALADLDDGRWLERLDLPAGVAAALTAALLRAGASVTAYVDDARWEQARPGEAAARGAAPVGPPAAVAARPTRVHADLAGALEGVAVTRLVVGGVPSTLAGLLGELVLGRPDVAVSPAPGGRYEVHHVAADKAGALARLCARLGVSPAGAVACGDGAPDAGMLRWAGLGIAVVEGDAAARDAADVVVPRAELPAALSGLVGR